MSLAEACVGPVRAQDLPQPRRYRPRHALARGFTLIELSIVVVLVAIFATLAVPQVTRQLRDRRVNETAQRVADIYRASRLRAVGQGGAVLVHYEPGAQGVFTVTEATLGGTIGCTALPSTSCNSTSWRNVDAL